MQAVRVVLGTLLFLGLAAAPAPAAVGNPHNEGSCAGCHLGSPRLGADTKQSVSFTTSSDDPALCAPCHPAGTHLHPVMVGAGSGPAGARRPAYLPAGRSGPVAGKVVCTTCHALHATDGRYALLRGFPGTTEDRRYGTWREFCADCHGDNLASRSAHRAGDAACALCHAARPKPGTRPEVLAGDPDPCALCHGIVREAHYAGADPFRNKRACRDCHELHGKSDERPGLLTDAYLAAALSAVTVRPHYSKGLCLACHTNVDDYGLRDEDVNALCNRCHDSGEIEPNIHPLREVPQGMTIPKGWPLEGRSLTCLTCHEQGHEDQDPRPAMLRGGPYARAREACANCHRTSDLASSKIHVAINEGRDCEICHKVRPVPGKDTSESVQLIADPNLLCLLCHDVIATDPSLHHTAFTERHQKVSVPDFLPLYQGRLTCATCHNPHLLEPAGYRLRSGIATTDFCTGCHAR